DQSRHGSWQGPSSLTWCRVQGCALQAPAFITHEQGKEWDDVNPDKMKYIRFWKVIPQTPPKIPTSKSAGHTVANYFGQDMVLLGDVPIESDGSFKAKLPANVPFLMAGVDSKGRAIARHQHVMAMRPGEKQVCSGCHLHATTDDQNAQHPFRNTIAAGKPAVEPELATGQKAMPEWRTDIYPMLQANCASCHDGSDGVPLNMAPSPNKTKARNMRELYSKLTNYNKK